MKKNHAILALLLLVALSGSAEKGHAQRAAAHSPLENSSQGDTLRLPEDNALQDLFLKLRQRREDQEWRMEGAGDLLPTAPIDPDTLLIEGPLGWTINGETSQSQTQVSVGGLWVKPILGPGGWESHFDVAVEGLMLQDNQDFGNEGVSLEIQDLCLSNAGNGPGWGSRMSVVVEGLLVRSPDMLPASQPLRVTLKDFEVTHSYTTLSGRQVLEVAIEGLLFSGETGPAAKPQSHAVVVEGLMLREKTDVLDSGFMLVVQALRYKMPEMFPQTSPFPVAVEGLLFRPSAPAGRFYSAVEGLMFTEADVEQVDLAVVVEGLTVKEEKGGSFSDPDSTIAIQGHLLPDDAWIQSRPQALYPVLVEYLWYDGPHAP